MRHGFTRAIASASLLALCACRAEPGRAPRDPAEERYPVLYAVADDPLPEGALAMVLRDPEEAWRGVVVLSRVSASDEVLALAEAALERDERAVPRPGARRVLRVGWDRRASVLGVEGGGTVSLEVRTHPNERALTTALWNAAERNPAVEMEGIGLVRYALR